MIKIIIIIRVFQFIFASIVLALSAATINNTFNGYERVDAYSIFCSIFTGISAIYFIIKAIYSEKSYSPFLLPLDLLNNVFWLCNFIALAAKRGPGICTTVRLSDNVNNSVVLLSDGGCRTGKASIVFAALIWATFIVTSYLLVRERSSAFTDHDEHTEIGGPTVNLPSVRVTPATADLEAGINVSNRTKRSPSVLEKESTITEPEKVYYPRTL